MVEFNFSKNPKEPQSVTLRDVSLVVYENVNEKGTYQTVAVYPDTKCDKDTKITNARVSAKLKDFTNPNEPIVFQLKTELICHHVDVAIYVSPNDKGAIPYKTLYAFSANADSFTEDKPVFNPFA